MKKQTENKTDALDALVEKVQTLTDRKGRAVQAIRFGELNGFEAETQMILDMQVKYPHIDGSKGLFVLINEGKRAVFANCGHKGCNEPLGLVRTSDLFQVNRCEVHRAPRKSKSKGGNAAQLKALSERLGS